MPPPHSPTQVQTAEGAVEKMRLDKPTDKDVESTGQRKGVRLSKAGANEKVMHAAQCPPVL